MTTIADPIIDALKLPRGARFYRCALQVNPFEYLVRHKKRSNFKTEADYNTAVIGACKEIGIEVIAVTDHYRVRSAKNLIKAAQEGGIHVFPGFEAVTKDGVHFLSLFDPKKDLDSIERVIGDCGIHEQNTESPTGKYDVIELLDECRKWKAICVAAHVTIQGGLLGTLRGRARMNAWTSLHLLACSLPGQISDEPENFRQILENKNAEHRRDRPLAIVNAQDVCDPDDFHKQGTSCWIKMSEISIEGLRQAFLDQGSRIRLVSDTQPEEHAELVALAWQGGFLDGVALHFNENLNVLVGGRGTGKSTVIESLRYVLSLEPLGDEARKSHEGIVRHVLRSGTKISLLLRSHRPNKQEYRIERTIPNQPIVRNQNGNVLNLNASDIVPQIEVYGQHEISELTRSPDKLTHLLDRFVEQNAALDIRKADLRRKIEQYRNKIIDTSRDLAQVEERLASLPALEETLKRFQEAGLEERLKEQSLLVSEEQVLKTSTDRIDPYRQILENLQRALPIDWTFASKKALENLPGKEILDGVDKVFVKLNGELGSIAKNLQETLSFADAGLTSVRSKWEERKKVVNAAYEKILRELQKTKIDGGEFIRLRRQIEELLPLREQQKTFQRDKKEHEDSRRNLLVEWEDSKAEEFRQLERAAKNVSRKLAERVRVRVTFAGNREPFFQILRDRVGGQLAKTIETISARDNLSLGEFAEACRNGIEALRQKYELTPTQAKNIADAEPEVFMLIEELDLSHTTRVELNVAAPGETPLWQALDELSTGQKATAVLLLLLLESQGPLVVDQPEEDLDNRFITEGVVPKIREEKCRRQFVFSTHNANIPVLGDAELIIGLRASGEAEQGIAHIAPDHMGSIDVGTIRELVQEILEGGKEAFETRRLKYGF